jgi:uncharacterized protein (TIGR02996 family)
MTHEEAFLQAIIENSDDDAPRLIYADWLDENGQPDRAEFIRIECQLAKLHQDDSRWQELEARKEQLLWVAYRENWAQQFGVAMSWGNALALFKWRLAQTTSWCRGRHVPSLRTSILEPASLVGHYLSSSGGQQIWRSPSTVERESIVNALGNRRAKCLSSASRNASGIAEDMANGRLLLFDPDGTLSDGAASQESSGFFDVENIPAWDTWVWYVEDRDISQYAWTMFASYLVAWVPPHLLEFVDAGIRINPEECIRWAADVDTSFTRRLRNAGLLA